MSPTGPKQGQGQIPAGQKWRATCHVPVLPTLGPRGPTRWALKGPRGPTRWALKGPKGPTRWALKGPKGPNVELGGPVRAPKPQM